MVMLHVLYYAVLSTGHQYHSSLPSLQCNSTPQPCVERGVTYCPSDSSPGQCDRPMPHPPCPPCPPPAPPLGSIFELSNTLGDDMVLQRAPKSAMVWGFARPGTVVRTTLSNSTMQATTDASGVWRQRLQPQPPSFESTTIFFAASTGERVNLTGVLFGDVHLCSGQCTCSTMNRLPLLSSHRRTCCLCMLRAQLTWSTPR
jgi:hypothetical protein